MYEQQQPRDLMREDTVRVMNLLLFVIRVWAVSIEVFIRRGMGRRYLGFQAIAVFFLIPCYCAYWEQYNTAPVLWFMLAYVIAAPLARARGQAAALTHSLYNGYPRMAKADPNLDEVKFKQISEPITIAIIGAACFQLNQPLGCYWMIGAGCLFIQSSVFKRLEDMRVMEIRDAMIEQSTLADRLRNFH